MKWTQGLFCGNFLRSNCSSQICRSAWCGECYTSKNDVDFFVKTTPGFDDTQDSDRLQHVWGKRQASLTAFQVARNGDHLMVPFECDTCIFWKLRGSRPNPDESPQDKLLLACIRRINLDAFWSRMTSTVTTNKDKVKSALKLSESVGLSGPYMVTESFPTWDHCGYDVAIEMVLASLKPGRYSSDYTQWDTIRKLRTAFSNHFRASSQASSVELTICDDRGHSQRISTDPCASVWFGRFFIGCKRRMGQDWRPNKAMSIFLIRMLLRRAKSRMENSDDIQEKELWLTFGTYLSTGFALSLRGVEGLLVDLEGMLSNINRGDGRYFIIALLGKIKGKHHGRCHLLPCVKETSSKIRVHAWVTRLMECKVNRGFVNGPLFSDWEGKVLTTGSLDRMLVEILEELFVEKPKLFPPSVKAKEDISDAYQVYRSIRRSSDSRALEQKVSESDIDIVNRWQKVEKAQGSRPTLQMKYHYASVEILLEPFLRYTYAM